MDNKDPDIASLHIPRAVAIIMDGNGRWALKRGLPRTMGHKEGARALENLIPEVGRLGIKYITVYAFSTENWKRSSDEVNSLMQLFKVYAPRLLLKASAHDVRIRFIGDRTRFPDDIQSLMENLEHETLDNKTLDFIIAANYGGRDEIKRASEKYALDMLSKVNAKKKPFNILPKLSEEEFLSYLDTYGIPDPDLLIRTSGEKRLSNFLLWQLAYSEMVFTDVLWPDFDKNELINCLREYTRRIRKFGGA